MKKHRKFISLYTFESNCTTKNNGLDWEDLKNSEGTTIDKHPSQSCKSFTTYKKAVKAAKEDAHDWCVAEQEWYCIIKFQIELKVVCKMFDGLYGAEGPTVKITKVFPIHHIDPAEPFIRARDLLVQSDIQDIDEEYEEVEYPFEP